MISTVFESPNAFARRTGLSDKIIRQYVRQGRLPHIKTGKNHVRIHVEAGLDALRRIAEETAAEKVTIMPALPFNLNIPYRPSEKPKSEKKYKGRPPGLKSRR